MHVQHIRYLCNMQNATHTRTCSTQIQHTFNTLFDTSPQTIVHIQHRNFQHTSMHLTYMFNIHSTIFQNLPKTHATHIQPHVHTTPTHFHTLIHHTFAHLRLTLTHRHTCNTPTHVLPGPGLGRMRGE